MSNNFMYIMSAIACLNLGFTIAVMMTLRSCVKFLTELPSDNSMSDAIKHLIPNRFVSYNGDAGKLYRKDDYINEED